MIKKKGKRRMCPVTFASDSHLNLSFSEIKYSVAARAFSRIKMRTADRFLCISGGNEGE